MVLPWRSPGEAGIRPHEHVKGCNGTVWVLSHLQAFIQEDCANLVINVVRLLVENYLSAADEMALRSL